METNKIIDITEVKELYDSQEFSEECKFLIIVDQLRQLLENQVAYILPAVNEFRELNKIIEKLVNENSEVPDFGLDLDRDTKISYDHKDIRPSSIDRDH